MIAELQYCTETNTYKEKKRAAVQNGTAAPKPAYIVFGGGGHNADGTPKTADPAKTALSNQWTQKDFEQVYNETNYSITYLGVVNEYELIDYVISEAGLIDTDGDLMAYMNFQAKTKKAGVQHIARFKLNF